MHENLSFFVPQFTSSCGMFFQHIFFNLSHKGTIFGKNKYLTQNTSDDFLHNIIKNIPYTAKNAARCYHTFTHSFMHTARYYLQTLMKIKFPRQSFEK